MQHHSGQYHIHDTHAIVQTENDAFSRQDIPPPVYIFLHWKQFFLFLCNACTDEDSLDPPLNKLLTEDIKLWIF
jgi:hypothetical protein